MARTPLQTLMHEKTLSRKPVGEFNDEESFHRQRGSFFAESEKTSAENSINDLYNQFQLD